MMPNEKAASENPSTLRPALSGSGPLTAATLALVNTMMHAGSALAQSTNAPVAEGTNVTTQLPDVVVKGQRDSYKPEGLSSPKYTEPLRDTPQAISVIPRAVMEDQGATTLREVLRNISGISMQAGEGGGGLPGDNLSIRGFTARSDIYVDGVRNFGAYSRDIFNTEDVEAVKGPSSVTTGRGSTGGSVNLVSKLPKLRESYQASVGVGTDDYRRGTVDINQPLKEIGLESSAVRLNVMVHENDAPGRDVVHYERWAVAPSVTFGLGEPTRLTLSYLHMKQENVPEYGIPWVPTNTLPALQAYGNSAPPVSYDNFYGLRNYDYEEVETDLATAIVSHDFNESLTLRSLFRYDHFARSSAITAPRFVNASTSTALNRQLQRRNMENFGYVDQTDLTALLKTGPIDHVIVSGFELSREEQNNRNSAQTANQPQADLYDPNPFAQPLGNMPALTGSPNYAKADTIAGYVFDTAKFGEKWLLSGGVRFDHIESTYSVQQTTNFTRTDNLPSWRVALVFKPRPNGSIYLGYATSFNPSLEAGNTGLSLATNTVALKPEETHIYEVGTKWDVFDNRMLLTATLFRAEKQNARTPGVDPSDPPTVLDGEVVAQGVEFEASGEITEDWKLRASYTFLDTEVTKSGNPLEVGGEFSNAPKHSFNLWTTYDLPGGITVGGGGQFVGSRWNGVSTVPNVRRAPAYYTFDAMLNYEVNRNLSFQLNVYNLADERYIGSVGGGHFIPGPGRSAVLSANLKF